MKFILIALGFCSVGVAFAGTPDQDAVIASYRQKFEQGHVPSHAELKLGRLWFCDERAAFRNSFQTFGPGAFMRLHDRGRFLYNNGPARLDWLEFAVDGLGGTITSARDHVIFIRVTDEGHLVLENTSARVNAKTQVPSLSNPVRGAFAYGMCLRTY